MSDRIEILKKARDLISDPMRWTRGDYEEHNDVGEACYCSLGALAHVQDIPPADDIPCAEELAMAISDGRETAGFWVARYNDENSHADVLKMFDSAIANLLAQSSIEGRDRHTPTGPSRFAAKAKEGAK